jgi:diadenosine tetraphosphate (Ap4A) HIT family hydrolase
MWISPFTKAMHGEQNQPIILENTHAAVLPNISPARPGHALVVSRRQVPKMGELNNDELKDIMELAKQYQVLWKQLPENAGKPFDFTLYMHDGVKGGQTVPHVHLHVVPIAHAKPVMPGSLRKAITPDTPKPGIPKTPAEWSSRLSHVYASFNGNVGLIKAFAEKTGVKSRFSAVA